MAEIIPPGWARLTGRIARTVADDEGPLLVEDARISIWATTPLIKSAGGDPLYVGDAIGCTLDDAGILLGPDGRPGVLVLASDGPTDPTDFTWMVRLSTPTITSTWAIWANDGEEVGLFTATPVPPNPGQAVVEWRDLRDQVIAARDHVDEVAGAVDADRQWAGAARAGAEAAAIRAAGHEDQARVIANQMVGATLGAGGVAVLTVPVVMLDEIPNSIVIPVLEED